ncbi:MAG TPA: glutathione peroxidase [Fimbriimonadaceae bacterium]|nr:glutathione peroxidase [Fimbriimonadaceae bacterium]HRJ96738.1 glutathione peroxidase [Fimbriimonadaceae bacterium]
MVTIMAALLAAGPAFTDFTMADIDGKSTSFKAFKGKVALVVNTASRCGLTPQYAGLEALYQKYKDQGFIVLGFPANDFKEQEPGSNKEIKAFCTEKYGVTFPMFGKVVVTGLEKAPLYRWLLESSKTEQEIEWNFAKFLVHRDGKTVERFAPKVTPEDKALGKAIEAALREE